MEHGTHPPDMAPLGVSKVGEVAVRGPVVTRSYYRNSEATERAKIVTDEGLWHLMGDLGYFDEQGRLWLVGRKVSHRGPTRWRGPLSCSR